MKIDYDKPVKGKLSAGLWWALHPASVLAGKSTPPEAFKLIWVTETQQTAWQNRISCVEDWRLGGWQFYRARLPQPAKRGKGAKC